MLAYAAGTVGCVYPRPVEHDGLHDLIKYYMDTGKDEYCRVSMTNAYDEDKNYVPAKYGKWSENEVSHRYITSFDGIYEYQVCKKWSHVRVIELTAKSLPDLITKMQAEGISGTLNVTFYSSYRCEGKEILKSFKCLL